MAAEDFVANQTDGVGQFPLERGALLRCVERMTVALPLKQHIGKSPRTLEDLGYRRGAACLDKVVGVVSFRQ